MDRYSKRWELDFHLIHHWSLVNNTLIIQYVISIITFEYFLAIHLYILEFLIWVSMKSPRNTSWKNNSLLLQHSISAPSFLVFRVSMKSQINRINKMIPYSCNITSLLHTFDTVLFDFRILSLNLESQIDIMKKIIPYSCHLYYFILILCCQIWFSNLVSDIG